MDPGDGLDVDARQAAIARSRRSAGSTSSSSIWGARKGIEMDHLQSTQDRRLLARAEAENLKLRPRIEKNHKDAYGTVTPASGPITLR